jgi:hypothetical protein
MSAQHLSRPGDTALPQSREGLEEIWRRLRERDGESSRNKPAPSSLF